MNTNCISFYGAGRVHSIVFVIVGRTILYKLYEVLF